MRYLLCLLLSLLMVACTAPQTRLLSAQALSQRHSIELNNVPFFSQQAYQCGPAALATMLQYTGIKVLPETLVRQIYVPERKGSFSIEMMASSRQYGRLSYALAPQLTAIFTALEAGFPVLVLQNNGLALYPVWHFAVIVGVDFQQQQFILRSGIDKRLLVSFTTFEHTWKRGNYWASLIIDPAQLPSWFEPERTLQQLHLLEKHGSIRAAQTGYAQAVKHWPEQQGAWLGWGNSSVALQDMTTGESAFKQLIQRFPQQAAGFNNLADLLLRQGRAQEALPLAQQAVKLLNTPTTQQTLAEVKAALASD